MSLAKTGFPLVTGATGFAGSHLLDRLLQSHATVHAWSNPGSRRARAADPRILWEAVELLDSAAVIDALHAARPSAIYHCAGLPHVAESWGQSGRALQVNAFGTHVLLDAVDRTSLSCPVVVTGSALVYRPSSLPLSEEDPLGPIDPYGISKLAQEMVALRAGGHVLLARPFNHAGPRQPSSFVTSSFARQVAEIEAGLSEPVLHVGNLDTHRDITDVRDTVRAYEALAASGRPAVPYNVCSGMAYRVGDLLEQLLRMARVKIRTQQDPSRLRPSDNPVVAGNPSRIAAETGWCAEIPIEQTLADLLDWWRAEVVAVHRTQLVAPKPRSGEGG